MKQLSSMESSEQTPAPESVTTPTEQHAAPDAKASDTEPSTPKPDGAPATAENSQAKPADQKPTEKPQSRFAKDQARLQGTWKEVNAAKEEFAKAKAQFEAEQAKLAKERQEFESERQKAAQPKHKPEDYETHANNLDAQAETLTAQGRYDEAAEAKAMAKIARKHAAELRANPPPAPATPEQKTAEQQAKDKEWITKAGMEFPNSVKDGSPEKAELETFAKQHPEVLQDPKLLYFAAERASLKTAAARVPTLEKELDGLRAKVKELEEQLSVPLDGSVPGATGEVPWGSMSSDDQLDALKREAVALG